ncbi:MAG: DUF1998 domain-containing protein [Planctomycetes bacterium]|nr:DUF1998 domain-containing protein [Planctomycetota bacterium]
MAQFAPFRVGQARRSQILHTYGVGSIVDLPRMSVMPTGLQQWPPPSPLNEITEDRLLSLVQGHLGAQVQRLVAPIYRDGSDPFSEDARTGVPVVTFPRWVRCPRCQTLAPLDLGIFKLKEDLFRPDRTCYVHANCAVGKPPQVVPARFVMACRNGHLDDFPWDDFIEHKTPGCRGPLEFQESGLSSEVADLRVFCKGCNAGKPMALAFGENALKHLPQRCTGKHPHLGRDFEDKGCDEDPRVMLIGASNLWFSIQLSALSLPTDKGKLRQKVDEKWTGLKEVTHPDQLKPLLVFLPDLGAWTKEEIWAAIEEKRRSSAAGAATRSVAELRREEWGVLANPGAAPKSDDFRIRSSKVPKGFEKFIADVVLVERLRVVRACIGFTRVDSPGDFGDPGQIPQLQRAPLSRSAPTWVPATEVRGEGVFLRLREDTLSAWLAGDEAKKLDAEFRRAHVAFRRARNIPNPEDQYPGLRYVVLHSLSHTLLRQFAIECGYSSASIEERIYSAEPEAEGGPMAGILLFTAAADSEGTLGGLVALGEPDPLRRHLTVGLQRLELCSSDPLCAEHRPDTKRGVLHGTACHSCLFVSETSCERGNKYLDRAVLAATVRRPITPWMNDVPTPHGSAH